MDKFGKYYLQLKGFLVDTPKYHQDTENIIYNLDNPVEYIYNLIK